MDFLNKLAKGDESKPSSDEKPSNSDLFSDAKVVAAAAQAQFTNKSDTYDNAKAAASAANILDAAEQYGKLDANTGVGKYVDQAEDYLRKYGGSGETKPTPETAPAEIKETEKKPEPQVSEKKPEAEEKKPEAEGGAGDYLKMAEGLLNKPEGGTGGAGDFAKVAGGFFK